MNDPVAPAAPDPVATAKAQGDMNQNTATTQQLLNMTNQVTPDGTLSYDQTGSTSFTGADGRTYSVPRFTATQTLSPTQQALKDLTDKTKTNLGNIGVNQSAKIGDLLGTNLKLGNEATEARLMDLGSKRLDPMFARNEDALRTRLSNSGIMPGSEAWKAEMDQFGMGKNDAYNSLLLSGRGQANTELLAERNAPINEITALMSGSQVSQPGFSNTPQTSVGGVDYAGMVNNNFNAANDRYKTDVASNNAMMGGLFGLAGTGATAAIKYSDRRLKSDVVRVGTSARGLPVYEYTIFDRRERGVMADEVEQLLPGAVISHSSGYKMVDYAQVGAL
jgi:hypothetical protein